MPYFGMSVILATFALVAAIPGLALLNQEYGWFPTQSGIYGIEVNGQSISNASAIRYSLGIAITFALSSIVFCVLAYRN
jgi:hypothetical protein